MPARLDTHLGHFTVAGKLVLAFTGVEQGGTALLSATALVGWTGFCDQNSAVAFKFAIRARW